MKNNSLYITRSTGIIATLKDGIAEIHGLNDVQSGELILSSSKNYGLVLNLQKSVVSAVFLSEVNLKVGEFVQRLYNLINIPISIFALSSVLNSLGNDYKFDNLNNKNLFISLDFSSRNTEIKAPGILVRQSVGEPLSTGIKIVDCVVPIGRGQRELIIGDRQTGKTAIAIDTIINQKI